MRNAHKPAEECICVTVDEQYRADEQGHNVRPTGVRIQMNPISEQDTKHVYIKNSYRTLAIEYFLFPFQGIFSFLGLYLHYFSDLYEKFRNF